MTRWNTPEAYQPRQFVHPNVDAVIDEIRAIRREQEMEADEPIGAIGWAVTGICAAFMGFAIGAQALWEVAL